MMDSQFSEFTPDITPIMLAAHTNNYEIIKLLVQRKVREPLPLLFIRFMITISNIYKLRGFFCLFFCFVGHYSQTTPDPMRLCGVCVQFRGRWFPFSSSISDGSGVCEV